MGIKSLLSTLWKAGGSAAEFASHWHTAGAILETFLGKKPEDSADERVKGLYGLFGMKDEKEWINVLRDELTEDEATAILDYVEWQFPRTNAEERLIAFYYGNKFRTFILTLGSKEQEVKFLKRIAAAYIKGRGGETGCQNVRFDLKRLGVPIPPEGAVEALRAGRLAIPDYVRGAFNNLNDAIVGKTADVNDRVADMRANRPVTQRVVKAMRFF